MAKFDANDASEGQGGETFLLRLPKGMKGRLHAAKEKTGLSINSQILRGIEMQFSAEVDPDHLVEAMARLQDSIDELNKRLGDKRP